MTSNPPNHPADLIGQALGLIDNLFTHPDQAQVVPMARLALRTMTDEQWNSFLAYLDSPKGQAHLQAFRDTTNQILEDQS